MKTQYTKKDFQKWGSVGGQRNAERWRKMELKEKLEHLNKIKEGTLQYWLKKRQEQKEDLTK